jgi:hypothetical protein
MLPAKKTICSGFDDHDDGDYPSLPNFRVDDRIIGFVVVIRPTTTTPKKHHIVHCDDYDEEEVFEWGSDDKNSEDDKAQDVQTTRRKSRSRSSSVPSCHVDCNVRLPMYIGLMLCATTILLLLTIYNVIM